MNLCQALSPHAEVVLFCHGHLYEQAATRGITCREIALPKKRWLRAIPFVSFSPALRRELAGFDVVHAYSLNVLPMLFTAGRPLVWTTHGFWERPNGLRARVIKPFVRRVVTVSSDVDRLASFGNKQRKIYLGAPLVQDVANNKTFDPDNVRIACVGRFQRIKGQDILLEAIRIVGAGSPKRQICLDLIGDVNGTEPDDIKFRNELMATVSRLNLPNVLVRFLGFQNNPVDFVREADFVVVPSRYESFSMAAIEALGCGKPVIAPAIGGPLDILGSSVVGRLFKPGDAESLAHTIKYAIADFEHFDVEACKHIARVFSVDVQANQHMALYREIGVA